MLRKSFTKYTAGPKNIHGRGVWRAIGLSVWVIGVVIGVQIVLVLLVSGLHSLGVSFSGVDEAVLATVLALLVYAASLAVILFVAKRRRHPLGRKELGLERLPSWFDLLVGPAAIVPYFILSALLLAVATHLFPWINTGQAQDIGFTGLHQRYEYVLALITLVILAPFAEETLFRGYLYGRIRQKAPFWLAALLTSFTFALLHFQWNVSIDVFALSLVLCVLRETTGSIWAGVLLHMLKNSLAFYFLFVAPGLLH